MESEPLSSLLPPSLPGSGLEEGEQPQILMLPLPKQLPTRQKGREGEARSSRRKVKNACSHTNSSREQLSLLRSFTETRPSTFPRADSTPSNATNQ